MPKVSYHHGDLRAALLAAASTRAAAAGGESVALRDLAREVGVSPNAAYRHFADREALLRAVAALALVDLGRALDDVGLDTLTGMERVRALAHTYLRWSLARPHLFRLAFGPRGVGHPDGVPGPGGEHLPGEPPRPQQHFTAAAAGRGAIALWALVHGVTALAVEGTFGTAAAAGAVLDQSLEVSDAARWTSGPPP